MKKKFQRYIKTIFVLALAITTISGYPTNASAEEAGIGNDDITVNVSQNYSEEANIENIEIGVQENEEGIQVLDVIDSESNSLQLNEGIYSNTVSENGEQEFTVKYLSANDEQKEYMFTVDTTSIQTVEEEEVREVIIPEVEVIEEEETEIHEVESTVESVKTLTSIKPFSVNEFEDGDVSIQVDGYDSLNGWKAGEVYDVTVRADFTDYSELERYVEISLPEGMRFVNYPVLNLSGNNSLEYQMTSPTDGLTQSVEATTQKSFSASTYYGKVKYKVSSDTGMYELKFKVTPDEYLAYGNKTFTNAISASAMANGSLIGAAKANINIVWSVTGSVYFPQSEANAAILYQTSSFTPQAMQIGYGSPHNPGYKEIEWKIPYPESATFKGVVSGTLVEHNETEKYVVVKRTNVAAARDNGGVTIELNTENVPVGRNTAQDPISVKMTYYDGETRLASGSNLYVLVQTEDEVPNKLVIADAKSNYKEVLPEAIIPNYTYGIKGNAVREITDQWMEMTIDEGYHAEYITYPMGKNGGSTITYTTNKGKEKTVDIYSVRPGNIMSQYGLSREIEKLEEGEYFTSLKVYIGDYEKNFASWINTDSVVIYNSSNIYRIYGMLGTGIDDANVKISFYAENDEDEVDASTLNTKTTTISRVTSAIKYSSGITASDTTVTAGEKINLTTRLSVSYSSSLWNDSNFTTAVKNPQAVLKIPNNIKYTNFKAVQDGKEINVDVSSIYEIDGEQYIRITCDTYLGGIINNKVYGNIDISFDLEATLLAKGIYNWEDYLFTSIDDENVFINSGVKDTSDINQNNSTNDYIRAYSGTNGLKIIDKKELLIDTYIQPKGGERQSAYVEGTDSTAVGFTPGTEGEYTVEIFNNRDEAVDSFYAYLPVPKENINFGDRFQNNKFSWNMKITGSPTVATYDSAGIKDDSLKSNYQIGYNSETLTVENYRDDANNVTPITWSSNGGDATKMIRVKLDTQMQPGEKAVFTFTYKVDETKDSVEGTEKQGAINDFRPYAYFNAGSSGWITGTRVGARLQIGTIEGQVFLDKDIDGYKNNSDTAIASKKVVLYKVGEDTPYLETTTDENGKFEFDDLLPGQYRVDFTNMVNSITPYFTIKNDVEVGKITSMVDNTGVNTGILTVDPTTTESKVISVGVMDYNPDSLRAYLDKTEVTVIEGNAQQAATKVKVNHTITPKTFEAVKATTDGIKYESLNTGIATVSESGDITAVAVSTREESTKVKLTITDIFGNTDTAEVDVKVQSNQLPELTLTQTTKQTLELGTAFDANSYVKTMSDFEDGTLTSSALTINGAPTTASGKLSAIGTYTAKYKVVDSAGNYAEKILEFEVKDTTAPTFNVEKTEINLEVNDGTTLSQFIEKLGTITKSDNDVSATLEVKSDNFSSLDQSVVKDGNKVIVYVSDPSGNKTTVEITVNIKDTKKPTVTVTKDEVTYKKSKQIDETRFLKDIGFEASDNSGAYTTSTDFASKVTWADSGIFTVTVNVSDASGNVEKKEIKVTIVSDNISIVDDFKDDDGIIVIYRNEDTGESLSYNYNLKLQVDGKDMTDIELSKVTWTIEAAGGFDDETTYVEIEDGSNVISAKKSGVVKLTANYEGTTSEIYVVVPGDVNRDGSTNTRDATNIQKYIRTNVESDIGPIDEFTMFLANMNGDEVEGTEIINTRDTTVIQKMVRQEITSN